MSAPPAAPAPAIAGPLPAHIGAYRILGRLGQGGMATVYRAEQAALKREVALKVVLPQFAADAVFRDRFLREAVVSARLNHANIVTCYDAGEAGGELYMALELVAGGDVLSLLKRHGGRVDESRALAVVRDALAGLDAVAEAGLVHRDIKPANIFLTAGGAAKLADLGLARATGADQVTSAGTIMGTPAYMAPEQVRGQADLDIRADLFSIGATLWHLLFGASPFTSDNPMTTLMRVLNEPLPDPVALRPDLSAGCVALLRRLLKKDRGRRHARPRLALAEVQAVIAAGDSPPPAGIPAGANREASPRQGVSSARRDIPSPAGAPAAGPVRGAAPDQRSDAFRARPSPPVRPSTTAVHVPQPAARLDPVQLALLSKRMLVDRDGCKAWIILAPGASFPRALLDQVLQHTGIRYGLDHGAMNDATRTSTLPRRIVIARGDPPAPDMPGRSVRGEEIPPLDAALTICVSDDGMTATALTRLGGLVPKDEIERAVKAAGLRFGFIPNHLRRLCEGPPDPTGALVIARGKAVREMRPAGFALNRAVANTTAEQVATVAASVAQAAVNLARVSAGMVLAKWSDGHPGEPGYDVAGHPCPPAATRRLSPESCAGEGTELGRDHDGGLILRATRDGVCQQLDDGAVRVVGVCEIAGDLGPDDPPVETSDLVVVRGNVNPGASISTASDVVVLGDLRDAHVQAGGSVEVHGAIGDGAQAIVAAGAVKAESIAIRTVLAGSVRISGEVRNSEITASGDIAIGRVAGGRLIGGGSVTVGIAGDRDGTTTELWAGHHLSYAEQAQLARLAERRQQAERERLVREIQAVKSQLDEAAGAHQRLTMSRFIRGDALDRTRQRLRALETTHAQLDRAAEDARHVLARTRETSAELHGLGDDASASIAVTVVAHAGVVVRLADIEPDVLADARLDYRLGAKR